MVSLTLSEWLEKISKQHRLSIDLNLERVTAVANNLLLQELDPVIVTVGGTNGKGSTVSGLEAIWLKAGFRVGAFTSPWLYSFNELIRIQGQPVSDEELVAAFMKIEAARGEQTLTVFEFNTLAALLIFKAAALDVIILEVGLGGRLDAVNIISPDVSVVTTIAMDHMDWLGSTREAIGFEKAGIFRQGRPAVCGDFDPPDSLFVPGVPLWVQGKDFGFERQAKTWSFWNETKRLDDLPLPSLLLQNQATVLQVIDLLQKRLPVSRKAIDQGLASMHLPGRIEVKAGVVSEIRDVSHNPAAVQPLACYLQDTPIEGKTRAVFSMLADKDIAGVLEIMREVIDDWFVAPIDADRAASMSRLQDDFNTVKINQVHFLKTLSKAYEEAKNKSISGDRVVIFGSFYTLAALKVVMPAKAGI